MSYRPSCSKSKRDTRRRNHIHLCKHNTLGLGWKKIKAYGSWRFLEWPGSQKIIEESLDIINSDHSLLRTQKSGRYKLEKKRKQVQRAESEKIKDVVWSQIEAEKEPFKFWKKFFWQFKCIHLNLFLKGFKKRRLAEEVPQVPSTMMSAARLGKAWNFEHHMKMGQNLYVIL